MIFFKLLVKFSCWVCEFWYYFTVCAIELDFIDSFIVDCNLCSSVVLCWWCEIKGVSCLNLIRLFWKNVGFFDLVNDGREWRKWGWSGLWMVASEKGCIFNFTFICLNCYMEFIFWILILLDESCYNLLMASVTVILLPWIFTVYHAL